MFLHPRKSFSVTIPSKDGADSFLCYPYVEDDPEDQGQIQGARIWPHIGAPVLVIVGLPVEGSPIYRPCADALRSLPSWPSRSDPGLCVGYLTSSTLEEVKRVRNISPVEVELDGKPARFDELPTWIGDRKAWMMAVDADAIRIQNARFPEIRTSDLDWSLPAIVKTLERRG